MEARGQIYYKKGGRTYPELLGELDLGIGVDGDEVKRFAAAGCETLIRGEFFEDG